MLKALPIAVLMAALTFASHQANADCLTAQEIYDHFYMEGAIRNECAAADKRKLGLDQYLESNGLKNSLLSKGALKSACYAAKLGGYGVVAAEILGLTESYARIKRPRRSNIDPKEWKRIEETEEKVRQRINDHKNDLAAELSSKAKSVRRLGVKSAFDMLQNQVS
ncbi:hypothetical protein J7444_19665 [Labrenzia sp. R4_1]|uniref:hypothetical protein n=1 Tax=Stappiaceae TaxID=2821832 RepID=UPI001ADC70D6|nr:hypothetical protein [Labrenzia sp. R4_1]MBO9426962.1 hypothetical protein [Labrenzia sp. R4_1]